MSNKTPRITVPGLRGGVPGGYVLGRQKGKGPVQLLSQPRGTSAAAISSAVSTALSTAESYALSLVTSLSVADGAS